MKFVKALFAKKKPQQSQNNTVSKSSAADSVMRTAEHIGQLAYGADLIEAALQAGSFQKHARKRIAELLDTGHITPAQIHTDITEASDTLSILSLSTKPEEQHAFISATFDESELLNICEQTQLALLRRFLVAKVHNIDNLKKLEKTLKASDKTAYKTIKQRLQEHKNDTEQQQQLQKKLAHVQEELALHAKRVFNGEYQAKVESLQRKVEQLQPIADAEWKDAVQELLAQCEATLKANKHVPDETTISNDDNQSSEEQLSGNQSPEPSAPETQAEALNILLESLTEVYNDAWDINIAQEAISERYEELAVELQSVVSSNTDIVKLSQALLSSTNRILDARTHSDAFANALSALNHTEEEHPQIGKTIAQLKPFIHELKQLANSIEPTGALTRIIKVSRVHEASLKKIEKHQKNLQKQVDIDLRRGQNAVNQGQLRRANGIMRAIEQALTEINQSPAHITRKCDELKVEVSKLNEWQQFAARPKIDSLQEKIQALVDAPLSPELQATKIKQYQQEWKLAAGTSASLFEEQWHVFKEASDKAYATCEEYYSTIDAYKQQHAERCQALITQLDEYEATYDWSAADWPKVEAILRSAGKEWRNCLPLPQKEGRRLSQAYGTVNDKIRDRVNAEYEKNAREKERIINSVQAVLDSENLEQSISVAKHAQQQWKSAGRCQHRTEEQLWKKFRKTCDAVFARRDTEKAAESAVIDKAIKDALVLVEKIVEICTQGSSEFLGRRDEITTLTSEYHDIDHIPKSHAAKFNSTINTAIEKAEQGVKENRQEKQLEAWQHVFEINLQANSTLYDDTLSEDARTGALANYLDELKAIDALPKQGVKPLIEKLQGTSSTNNTHSTKPSKTHPTSASAVEAFQKLCIYTEIATGSESPESDKALRMAYQVELLNQGQNAQLRDESSTSLAAKLFALRPVDKPTYTELFERFHNCWRSHYLAN